MRSMGLLLLTVLAYSNRLYVYRLLYLCILLRTFSDIHSLVPSSALYITLAYFTAVLNRGQNSNEKELS